MELAAADDQLTYCVCDKLTTPGPRMVSGGGCRRGAGSRRHQLWEMEERRSAERGVVQEMAAVAAADPACEPT